MAGATARATTVGGTAIGSEIAKFDRLASRWWDPRGPMAPLHAMNPARMGWITERLARAHRRDPAAPSPLSGLRVLDVGCGAGLASEFLARAGADVTGLDAAAEAIGAARAHAARAGLRISYREGTPESLLATGEMARFDAVLALEVIEHVADRAAFCRHLADLLKPDGRLFLSTLNRTARSLLLAKIGAEYVLRLLPAGTHDWRMFVRPSELGAELRGAGLKVADLAGLSFDVLSGRWRTSRDLGVNYIAMAVRG
jgi:2-polyprenyl-6-hydroxyphenyl methylase / 3-demethylubiquinone-9 3-methyltransferase